MHTFTYFSSGSMNKSLTILGFDPLVLGGAHSFPLGFVGTFNLPEISSYIGILPVMGLFGLLARRHRRAPEAGQWWIWYAILVVGLFLAWGGFTPVAHLVYDIPLFNRQRLLNRNLLEVDLALAVIFAIWVDRMFTPVIGASRGVESPPATGGLRGPNRGQATPATTAATTTTATSVSWRARGPGRWTSDVVLPLLPVVGVVGLQVTLLAGGPWFPHSPARPRWPVTRSSLWPLIGFLTIPSAIAVAAGWIVVRRRRLGPAPAGAADRPAGGGPVRLQRRHPVHPRSRVGSSASSATANRLAALLAAQGQGPAGGLHRWDVRPRPLLSGGGQPPGPARPHPPALARQRPGLRGRGRTSATTPRRAPISSST
jgi:hypothetical protein